METNSLFRWLGYIYRTSADDEHGALMPVVVAVLFWWKRRELAAVPKVNWWPGLVLIGLGYLLPGFLEMAVRRAAETMHLATLALAVLGLLLHAMLDGAGLAGSEMQPGAGLAAAIVLHRFGDGLMIWLIMQPVFGQRAAWFMLAGLSAATILGFEFSERLLPLAGAFTVSAIQAVIIGTIIHTLAHRGHVHSGHQPH